MGSRLGFSVSFDTSHHTRISRKSERNYNLEKRDLEYETKKNKKNENKF